MASDIYITFTDANGKPTIYGDFSDEEERKKQELKGRIVVLRWGWGIKSKAAETTEQEASEGQKEDQDKKKSAVPQQANKTKSKEEGYGWELEFDKVVGRSSPLFVRALLLGEKIPQVTLTMRKATGNLDPVKYLVITVKSVSVDNVKQHSTEEGETPTTETITLSFEEVGAFEYTPIGADGMPVSKEFQRTSWKFPDEDTDHTSQAHTLEDSSAATVHEAPEPAVSAEDYERPVQVLGRIPGATAWEVQPRTGGARPLLQENRQATITTPIKDQGHDALVLKRCSGIEELGRLFSFDLVMISQKDDIKFDDIIGKNVTISLSVIDGQTRYFNGYISRFFQTAPLTRYPCYHATLVPWLWFLTLNEDCRIFQKKTVPEIIEAVFKGHGFTGEVYQNSLKKSYEKWEYCVQYGETDFNFISRLMEYEGIYYFFKHEKDKHILVLADSPSNHDETPPVSGYGEIGYRPPGAYSGAGNVWDWVIDRQFRTGAYTHTDFDFQKPSTPLQHRESIQQTDSMKLEIFEYPGLFMKESAGMTTAAAERYAKIRREEIMARSKVVYGRADARGIFTGYKLKLKQFPRSDQNGQYLVWSATHTIDVDAFTSGNRANVSKQFYDCFFHAIDATTQFRPARSTPKPVVHGPQTAIVVGPDGEEIYTDEYGRVKVKFHWDLQDKDADDNPIQDADRSCWVRVSQAWAGKNWGGVCTPRIGQEVIVEFLEGDPDRPIITGRVYNKEAMPPYALPANKTQSGIKSRSSKQGTTDNFNELRFEDNKGNEEIYFHAEKNFNRIVENNDTLKVGFEKKDQGDQTVEIHNNQKLIVGNSSSGDGSQTVDIYKDRTQTLKTGNETLTVKQGNRDIHIEMGNDTLSLKMGDKTTKLDLGKSSTEAMQSIELKVGQSSIKVDQAGVTIQGMMIKVEGQVQTEVKGLIVQVSGDALLQAKGGITMIG